MVETADTSRIPGSKATRLKPARCAYCQEYNHAVSATPRLVRCSVCGSLSSLPFRAENYFDQYPDAVLPVAPGDVLRDKYRLVTLLGAGAHGVAFLAHHEFLNNPCVVKILPTEIRNPSDLAVRRMRNEASAGYRVHHTNVVRVLDGDVLDGLCYFVMEYVEGVDLGEATRHKIAVDWRQAVAFARDVAEGLEAIHNAGLLHHDIKPGNLILSTDGSIRIADLGVARLITRQKTEIESPCDGTPAYAAPEVLEQSAGIGPTADLYSLGATLFELVTNSLPGGSDSLYKSRIGPSEGEIAWPDDAPDGVPEWFINVVLKLLAPAPRDRFQSAAALIAALDNPDQQPMSTETAVVKQASKPRGVVVLPFDNKSGRAADDWRGHALADHLTRSLSALDTIHMSELDQFLPTLERIREREPDRGAAALLEAGRLSGAGTVVAGEYRLSGDQIELALNVYQDDQDSPRILSGIAGDLTTLTDLEQELLANLVNMLGQPLPAAAKKTPAPPPENVLAAEELFFKGKRAFLNGDYDRARTLGLEAIEKYPSYGDALSFVGVCCTRMGDYERAVEYMHRSEELALTENDEQLTAQVRANMGSMHYFRGEYEAAYECLTQAEEIAERLRLSAELAQIRNNLGFVLLQLGRQSEAGTTFHEAIESLKRDGVLVGLVGPYNGLGHVLREQKHYDQARQYFRRALVLAQESDDTVNMGVAYMNLGHCAMLQGRLSDAKHELPVAENILEQTSFWNGLARVYEYMTELNLRLSNCDEAVRCADKWIDLARRHSNTRMESAAWQQKSKALQAAGRAVEAVECLKQTRQREDGARMRQQAT